MRKAFFSVFFIVLLFFISSFPAKAAAGVNEDKVVFAYMADLHIAVDAPSVAGAEKCVADINSRDDIQFVIIAGDVTEFGTDREIAEARKIFDALEKPYYILAGNHDAKWSESGCNTFLKVFGYEHFAFEAGGIRFIGCNSGPNMRMAPALLPRESMLWLESLVEEADPEQPVIFINHYPMDDSMLNYFQVIDLLKKTNVQLIMCGHGHNDRVMDFEGIPGVMGRSALENGKDGPGYNIVTIDGGKIEFREKIAGGALKQPWYTVRMSRGKAFDDATEYPRPDFSVNDMYPQVKAVWSVQDRSDIGSGAVMSGKYVVYANTSGEVRALNSADGSLIWEYETDGKIFSTPAIASGKVIIGSTDNNVYCFELATGKLLWKYMCDKSVLASPSVYSGKVYIGASDNRFRCLDLRSGRLLWTFDKVEGFVESKPYVDASQVVFGDWANKLYSLDPSSGKLQWTWTNKKGRGYSAAAVWPVKSDDRIYIVTPERVSYCLRSNTGYQIWKKKGGRESIGLSPDKSLVFVKTMQDTVLAFSAADDRGSLKWASNAGFGYEISPTPITSVSTGKGRGIVFVPTDKGNIIALDMATGNVLWRHKVSYALINYIQPVGKNRILVSTMDGMVTLLEY